MTIHKSKYSMIFKTFDSDIDNISSKWGLFGKSFYDVSTDIEKRWNNVSKTLQSTNDYTLQNITNAWKMGNSNPIKFLADDEVVSILDRYNKALDSGAEATANFLNSGTGNEFMDGFLKDLDGAPATMDKYKVATKNATMAQKTFSASTIATKAAVLALNVAVSMGLSIALSALIKIISEVAQSEENLKDSARELGSELSDTTSSVNDYKDKIEELKGVLSDSSSSFDDVSQARVDLMKIQDELIDKFGTEKGIIEDITEAIYGQTDALDELSRDAYYKAKNEFNEKTNGDKFKDWLSFGSTDDDRIQSNMDKMVSQMRSSVYELETTGNEVLDNLIAKSYGLNIYDDMYGDGQHFLITGELDEIQEKLYGIQELSQDFDVSTGFENNFTEISNDVDSLLESYQDLYDQYVLYEKILTNNPDNEYDEQFKLINQAKEVYDEAVKSGDADAMQKASENYAQTLSSAIDSAMNNYDYDVVDYFGDMYPDMQQMFSEWKFTLDFEPNTDGLKDKVSNSLIGLEGFSSEDIMAFNPNVATEEQITAYGELNNIASEYGLTLQGLINLLMQMGLIQSESYQQMVTQFGQDNVNKIAPEDLVFAYQIQNVGDMTFEEFQAEIQRLKEESQNPDEITVLGVSETVDELNTKLKPAMDSLKSAWEDIFSGENGEMQLDKVDLLSVADEIKSALDEMSDPKGLNLNVDYSAYEDFISILKDTESTQSDVEEGFDRLAQSIVNASVSGAEDFDTLKSVLEDLGFVESELTAFEALVSNTESLKEAGLDLKSATPDEFNTFIEQLGISAENTAQAIDILTFAKELCNIQGMDTSGEVANLKTLAENAGYTGDIIKYLTELEQIYQDVASGTLSPGMLDKKLARAEELKGLIEASAANINYEPKFDGNSISSGASKAGKEAADAYLEAFEKELEELDTLRSQGKLTEKQYLDALRRLYLKYFRDKEKYLKEYAKYEHDYLDGKLCAIFYSNVEY